ncbi:MAG TPA: TolC family protein, partial [Rhizomicrobium sp.]|nr:TolC family protein [Rhizomicrobium sp.]
ADLDLAVTDYNGAVLGAIKQTADAMTQVSSLAAQRVQQQDAVNSAERAFRIAEDRYRSGLATQLPMLTAEATLLQARQALVGVVAQGAQQRIALMLTVGGSFEPPALEPQTRAADLRQSIP